MAKYCKKPVVVEATQWLKDGDHSAVEMIAGAGDNICGACLHPSNTHGWCSTLEGQHIVCVGDWIITVPGVESFPCKPDIFEMTYEAVA